AGVPPARSGQPEGPAPGPGLGVGEGAPGVIPRDATTAGASTAANRFDRPLLTHEMGSLDKLGWRVKAVAGRKLEEPDLEEARAWGRRIGVQGYEELLELLARSPLTRPEDKLEVKRWGSRYGLRLQEAAGLAVVYDGEQQRTEMSAWAGAHPDG